MIPTKTMTVLAEAMVRRRRRALLHDIRRCKGNARQTLRQHGKPQSVAYWCHRVAEAEAALAEFDRVNGTKL